LDLPGASFQLQNKGALMFKAIRTIISSYVKANLSGVLSSLRSRTHTQSIDPDRLSTLAIAYSKGLVSWPQIAEETNVGFGELLVALGKGNLSLPKVQAKNNPEQIKLLNDILDVALREPTQPLPLGIGRFRIIIPDACPINTLAAAGLLHLLFATENTELYLIRSVYNEIIAHSPELECFFNEHSGRTKIFDTSVCRGNKDKRERGEQLEKGQVDLAIADFFLNYIDDIVGESPGLLITDDEKLLKRMGALDAYPENIHFITTAAYLDLPRHD
jgi:hypothetical protein